MPDSTNIVIEELTPELVNQDFLDCLAALSPVDLTVNDAKGVLYVRTEHGDHTYVAIMEGRIVGTVALLYERKFIHGGGLVGFIEDLAVHPDFQKQGVGLALINHVTKEALGRSCYKVILSCSEDLKGFYEKSGYHAHGVTMRKDAI